MHGDLDLFVKQRGQWSMYRMYPASSESDALKDAHFLEREKTYDVILLLNDIDHSILFSAGMPPGKRLSYSALRKEIKASQEEQRTSVSNTALESLNKSRMQRQMAQATPPQPKKQNSVVMALKVGLTGFGLTLLVAFALSSARVSGGVISIVFILMGAITLALTTWVHSLYEKQPKSIATKEEATQQLQLQKKLRTSGDFLKEAFYLGKVHIWEEETQTFKKDGHFALILYMLGMSQGFKNTLSLPHGKTQQQISELFTTVGISPESIVNCAANLSEYLIYPRYYAVYQKGVSDVTALHENEDEQISLQKMFEAWYTNNHAPQQAPTPTLETTSIPETTALSTDEEEIKPRPVIIPSSNFAVVVFTDIVGSTEKILENGEEWMVDVLQAHNGIVREAIQAQGGHEVKHTGDGIMMSFPSIEASLEASIAIQSGITAFNQERPERAFPVRIGMSAGEPTQIDGDLFGLPVNLAARVLPFATEGQIALSASCYNLATNLDYTFIPKENCTFKGFEEPQTVYFLHWQAALDGTPTEDSAESIEGASIQV